MTKITQSEAVYGFAVMAISLGYFVAKEGDSRTPIEIAFDMVQDYCVANSLGLPNVNYDTRVVIPTKPVMGDKSDAAPIFQDDNFKGV